MMPTWESIAEGFNAWLEDYIEHREKFNDIQAEVVLAIEEASAGGVPTYGQRCAATLEYYIKSLS